MLVTQSIYGTVYKFAMDEVKAAHPNDNYIFIEGEQSARAVVEGYDPVNENPA